MERWIEWMDVNHRCHALRGFLLSEKMIEKVGCSRRELLV
jgi:hypothetical protein